MIPNFVAEYLNITKGDITLMRVLEIASIRSELPGWKEVYDWVSENDEMFARAWLDGYKVVEPKYFAKIKGHENIGSNEKYWNYCITDNDLDIGDNKVHDDVLSEYMLSATKDEWSNLGINEYNADFVKVEEVEE